MIGNLIGIGAALGILGVIALVTRRMWHRPPDIEIRDGWLIEHGRSGVVLHCTDCDFQFTGTDQTGDHLAADELIDRLIVAVDDAGIHQHIHQEGQ